MKIKTLNDEVMRLERGSLVEHFSYEEWLCARYMWVGTGQRTGEISYLYEGSMDGALTADALEVLRDIVQQTQEHVLPRQLRSDMQHGGGIARLELFELIKKRWKLAYRHLTDSSDKVKLGTKTLGDTGAPDVPRVPCFGDISAFRSAYAKLHDLLQQPSGELRFAVTGPVFPHQRVA